MSSNCHKRKWRYILVDSRPSHPLGKTNTRRESIQSLTHHVPRKSPRMSLNVHHFIFSSKSLLSSLCLDLTYTLISPIFHLIQNPCSPHFLFHFRHHLLFLHPIYSCNPVYLQSASQTKRKFVTQSAPHNKGSQRTKHTQKKK
jgi:hypothetical protein